MSYEFDSRLGEQLYQLLPEVYRTRDRAADDDLAKYLDAHGHLLDLIHATLEQQLRDTLPATSQDWLLPYFAQLLAAKLFSPDPKGRHEEVKHAVSWRQRKGTLKCVEEIAEAVGQMEVEIQEGWKRVAITPRIGMPLMRAKVWDDTLELDMNDPYQAARHPSLPAAMVDLRQPSRAVETKPTNPAARTSNFSGERITWRQANSHGAPCFPDSFDDVSRRVVDVRTADVANGRYHHKRLLLFVPPPTGIFTPEPIRVEWDKRGDSLYEHLIDEYEEGGVQVIRSRTNRLVVFSNIKNEEGVEIDVVTLPAGKNYRIENIRFSGTLLLTEGSMELEGVEAARVEVDQFSTDEPALTACNCLFEELSVGSGLAKLDSCTILGEAHLRYVEARDCIFTEIEGSGIEGVIEYSRIPDDKPFSPDRKKMAIKSHSKNKASKYGYDPVTDNPSFMPGQNTLSARAVLSPYAPASIYTGASDKGELGYYHHGRKDRPVRIEGESIEVPDSGGYPLADIIFEKSIVVTDGKLMLIRSAAPSLTVTTKLKYDDNDAVVPSLEASDCLFDELTVSEGLARLEYCTVMQATNCKHLQASDCIFVKSIANIDMPESDKEPSPFLNCIRFSSIPIDSLNAIAEVLRLKDSKGNASMGSNTVEAPVFIDFDYCENGIRVERKPQFSDLDYGVLDQTCPDAIRFGAEDGGEMGACHHKYHSLKEEAVREKVREFLPVGIEPVLIQDVRLLNKPPEQSGS